MSTTISQDLPQGTTRDIISLMIGHPDPATLNTPELQAAMQAVLTTEQAQAALQYGPEQGCFGLIRFLVTFLNVRQGLTLQPSNIMITAGSTGALDTVARLFAGAGSTVLIEAPTYADSIHILKDHRINLQAVPIDEDGLIVEALAQTLSNLRDADQSPAFLYAIPTFQNPGGVTVSLERREQILSLAAEYNFTIVEDDVYRDLYFETEPPPSFYALSGGQNVLSIGSFSKILAPGLRLGWLVGAPEIIEQCVACGTTQMGGGANPFAAQIVAEYCRRGHWEAHIEHLRAVYRTRRDVALGALQQAMPDSVRWTQPAGGFFIWITLPEHIFAHEVKREALKRGVTLSAGTGFFLDPADGDHSLRITYSFAPLDDIENGVKTVAAIISRLGA